MTGVVAFAAAPPAKELTGFERIAALLHKDGTIDSVAKLLPKLPDKSLLEDYVLMRETQSLQSASKDAPRVILFGGSGDLVLAYDSTGESLEAIEFDRKKKRWDFYAVAFKEGKVHVRKNPDSCTGCHTKELRPNWEPYAYWPGAYNDLEDMSASEKKAYGEFVKHRKADPLYSVLPGLEGHYDRRVGSADPNTRLSAKLAVRNFQRIARQIAKNPSYESLRYALVAAQIPGCWTADAEGKVTLPFLPPGEFRDAVEALASKALGTRRKRAKNDKGKTIDVTLAILGATGQKASPEEWAMTFSLKDFHARSRKDEFSFGLGGADRLLTEGFYREDPKVKSMLAGYVTPYSSPPKVPKDESPAEARSRKLTVPIVRDSIRLSPGKVADACKKATAASLAALKTFAWQRPKDLVVRGEAIATHTNRKAR